MINASRRVPRPRDPRRNAGIRGGHPRRAAVTGASRILICHDGRPMHQGPWKRSGWLGNRYFDRYLIVGGAAPVPARTWSRTRFAPPGLGPVRRSNSCSGCPSMAGCPPDPSAEVTGARVAASRSRRTPRRPRPGGRPPRRPGAACHGARRHLAAAAGGGHAVVDHRRARAERGRPGGVRPCVRRRRRRLRLLPRRTAGPRPDRDGLSGGSGNPAYGPGVRPAAVDVPGLPDVPAGRGDPVRDRRRPRPAMDTGRGRSATRPSGAC